MLLLTHQTKGLSVLELKRPPGVSYLTTWQVKRQLLPR